MTDISLNRPDAEAIEREYDEALRFHCVWSGGYPNETKDVTSTFFQTDIGYTDEDINDIMYLEVGETLQVDADHVVTRTS